MNKIILFLGIGGLLFAGYLSAVKFFSNACALGESCPYFLGYPACYYGFAMYLLITIFATFLVTGKMHRRKALAGISIISFLGILFAGYFTVGELPVLFTYGFSAYALGLPTCAWGLVFYVALFLLSMRERIGHSDEEGYKWWRAGFARRALVRYME
ncbi:hypothetical protein FJY93_03135 [Candidatus Kaiserbacteria bacterium]|nr:hypothetical protein [Candidatus Kaiserbacteria bacterium]